MVKIPIPPGAFTADVAGRKRWRTDPRLLTALLGTLPRGATVVDCGAGGGRYVAALREYQYRAVGVDGTLDVAMRSGGLVLWVDLSVPCRWDPPADWGICIEVGEHVPAERAGVFIDNVAAAATDGLIVSWAVPGQRGRNHVNCRPPDWVAAEFAARGWVVDTVMTPIARSLAGRGWHRKLLIFQRGPT